MENEPSSTSSTDDANAQAQPEAESTVAQTATPQAQAKKTEPEHRRIQARILKMAEEARKIMARIADWRGPEGSGSEGAFESASASLNALAASADEAVVFFATVPDEFKAPAQKAPEIKAEDFVIGGDYRLVGAPAKVETEIAARPVKLSEIEAEKKRAKVIGFDGTPIRVGLGDLRPWA